MRHFFTRTEHPSKAFLAKSEARIKLIGEPIAEKRKEKARYEEERLNDLTH